MLKRIFSSLIFVCLLASVCTFPVYAQGQSIPESVDYMKYDLDTGRASYYSFDDLPDATSGQDYACSPGYFPNGIEPINPTSPYAIIGTDNRTRVNPTNVGPYCSTVYIYSTFSTGAYMVASGFMIGPYAVATAAHCVYNSEHGGAAVSVTVIPAKNGAAEPYGKETVSADNLVVSWEYTQTGSADDDWAVIELNTPLGNQTGWLGLRWQSTSYNNTFVYNTGYPSASSTEEQLADASYMFVGTGYVRESGNKYLKGDWDATGGNSGGPVFAYYNNTGYTLIGILTGGSTIQNSAYPSSYTFATRITENLYNFFNSYRTSPV